MNILKIYSEEDISRFINNRPGETKLGEAVTTIFNLEELGDCSSKYVLLGIPEDIGVRANYGNAGTALAYEQALKSLLNIQANSFTNAENLLVLGEIDCEKQMAQAREIFINEPHGVEELGELVLQIDHKVSQVVERVIAANKIPIIIGGGHNNSYGNLKGFSEAMGSKVNSINLDAHTDFRSLEHRHSGNGFSYAFEDGYLDKYFIFGLHRNCTSQTVYNAMLKTDKRVKYNFYEDMAISQQFSFEEGIKQAEAFCGDKSFGVELDMDAIAMMGSSAISPDGFSLAQARTFIQHFAQHPNVGYFHICEGAPALAPVPNQVGKAIAYLVSDIISIK